MFKKSEKIAKLGLASGFLLVPVAIFWLNGFWFKLACAVGLGLIYGSGLVLRRIGMERLREESKLKPPFG